MHGLFGHLTSHLCSLSFFQSCLDSLHDDDGIVHHGADDQHKGKERQHVQRETDGIDDGQCGDERDDDGDGGDDGSAPTAQEEPHHKDNQQQGFEQRLHHAGNGGIEEVLFALQVLYDDTWGQ